MKYELPMPVAERELFRGDVVLLLVNHRSENATRIAETVSSLDPDIIALEFHGSSDGERADLEDRMNRILSGNYQITTSDFDDTELALIAAFHGTGTRFHYIDYGSDSPYYGLSESELGARRHYADVCNDSPWGTDRHRNALGEYIESAARSDRSRERVMRYQIEQLSKDHPAQRIVAVVGITHTGIGHGMTLNVPLYRQFVPFPVDEILCAKGQRAMFSLFDIAVRATNLLPGRSDGVVERVIDRICEASNPNDLSIY